MLGVLAREATEGGTLIYFIVFYTVGFVKAKYNNKTFWRWKDSNFRNPRTNGFHWLNFIGLCVYSINTILAGFAVVFTFKFAMLADMNQGILTTLFGLAAIFSSIIAYFIFGDRLKVSHVSFIFTQSCDCNNYSIDDRNYPYVALYCWSQLRKH